MWKLFSNFVPRNILAVNTKILFPPVKRNFGPSSLHLKLNNDNNYYNFQNIKYYSNIYGDEGEISKGKPLKNCFSGKKRSYYVDWKSQESDSVENLPYGESVLKISELSCNLTNSIVLHQKDVEPFLKELKKLVEDEGSDFPKIVNLNCSFNKEKSLEIFLSQNEFGKFLKITEKIDPKPKLKLKKKMICLDFDLMEKLIDAVQKSLKN